MRISGGVSVTIGGQDVDALLAKDERGLDPTLGGMISSASQNILIPKDSHPARPAENASVVFNGGELSDGELVASSVTDRGGYWLVSCDEPLI